MSEALILRLIEMGFQYASSRMSYDEVKAELEPKIKAMKDEGKTDEEIVDMLAARAQSAIDAI